MREKKVTSLKIVFEDDSDYVAICEKGMDKDEVIECIERAFRPEPAEPLIKDEKVRKTVRAWAGANGLSDKLKVINEHFNCCKVLGRCDTHNVCHVIEFGTTIAGADKNRYYTIAELCGEEEE